MNRTLTLCAVILAVTCAAYATGRQTPDRTDVALQARATPGPWIPMSFDIETAPPPEDQVRPDPPTAESAPSPHA